MIDADALDEFLFEAQKSCQQRGEYFRFGVLSNVRANIMNAPTIDAIPMWWITEKFLDVLNKDNELSKAVWLVRKAWQNETGLLDPIPADMAEKLGVKPKE